MIFVPAQAARKIPTEMTRSVFAVFIRWENKIGCFWGLTFELRRGPTAGRLGPD